MAHDGTAGICQAGGAGPGRGLGRGPAVLAVQRPGPRARSCAWRFWPTPISKTAMTGAPRPSPWPGRWRRSAPCRRRRSWCSLPATWPTGAGPTPWIWAGKSSGTCPAPCWAVRGEGDHGPGGKSAWVRRWGEPWFSRAFRGFHLLGLDTSLNPRAGGPVFEIGAAQRQWLARELALLSPATPLIILSHAPLARLFHPWQQWTGDAPEVARLLARFSQVLCLHGHVHGAGIRGQGSGVRNDDNDGNRFLQLVFNRKPKTENRNPLIACPPPPGPGPWRCRGRRRRRAPGWAPAAAAGPWPP